MCASILCQTVYDMTRYYIAAPMSRQHRRLHMDEQPDAGLLLPVPQAIKSTETEPERRAGVVGCFCTAIGCAGDLRQT